MFQRIRHSCKSLSLRFLGDDRGTPSIETVLIIALVALAVAPMLQDLGTTMGTIFTSLGDTLEAAVNVTPPGG